MSKKIFTILLVLLIATSVHAASEYVTVVGDNAPASDVVNAANFAASMKGSVAVSFAGMLQSDWNALSASDKQHSLAVFIGGKAARILKGDNPDFVTVAQAAQVYLERQGFSVSTDVPRTIDESPPAVNVEIPVNKTTTPPGNDELDSNTPPPAPAQDQPAQEQQPKNETPPAQPPAPAQQDTSASDDNPGFFTKLWHWFATLFS